MPRTGTWQPACPRAAGASTPMSWPLQRGRHLLRSGVTASPRPLARATSPWPPGLLSALPAPSWAEVPKAWTRGRAPSSQPLRGNLPGVPGSRRSLAGRAGLAGARGSERAVSWSRTPVGRRAGLRAGRGDPASGPCAGPGGPRAGLGGVCRPALAVGTREGVLGAGVQAVAALERAAGRLPSCSLPGEVMNVLVDPFHRPGKERPRMGGTGSGLLVPRVWEAKSQVTGSVTTVEAGTGLCGPGRTGGWRGNTEPAQSVPVDSPTPVLKWG